MLLRTLGGLALEGSDFTRPKPLMLLAYVALEGPVDRRRAAELFWPHARDRMKSLRVALSRIRRAAADIVGADRSTLWAAIESDAEGFIDAWSDGDAARAVRIYTGPFLPGFRLRNESVEVEEWVYETREYLAGCARRALISLAHEEAGRNDLAAAAARAEEAYRLGGAPPLEPHEMRSVYRGLRAADHPLAGAVLEEAETVGLDLAESRQAARAKMRKRGANARPHNLQPATDAFVGRDAEQSELAELLAEERCRLLTLVGPAGVGKTRLAAQLGERLLESASYPDGIHWVPLEDHPSARAIPWAIAEATGVDIQGREAPLDQLTESLGPRDALLILDNFEHMVDGAALLADVLRRCPSIDVLVTSRERLRLAEEQIFPVAGLPFPVEEPASEREAMRFDAVRLFVERAKRSRPAFELTPESMPHAIEVCRLVEGLPLGVELAAAWVRVMTCREIAGELEHGLGLLRTTARNADSRHRSIAIAFERSWRLLDATERRVLSRAATFRGGFRRKAASEVAGATIPVLASLVDKSLLRMDGGGRYDRHPLLYRYTKEKLADRPDEHESAREAHRRYFVGLAERSEPGIWGPDRPGTLRALAEEMGNLGSAWRETAAQGDWEDLLRMVEPMSAFFDVRNRFHEGVEFFGRALEHLDAEAPEHRAALGSVWSAQAWLLQRLGRQERSVGLARRALDLLDSGEEPKGAMRARNTLGAAALRAGKLEAAEDRWTGALALARRLDDPTATAHLLNNLAVVAMRTGRDDLAERRLQDARSLGHDASDHVHVHSLSSLGILHARRGELQRAIDVWREGLERARAMDSLDMIPYFLANMGRAARELENHSEAREMARAALEHAQEHQLEALVASAMELLGTVEHALGDADEAEALFERAAQAAWAVGRTSVLHAALLGLAEVWVEREQYLRAVPVLAYVADHPTVRAADLERARRTLDDLSGRMPSAHMAAAIDRGRRLELEDGVGEAFAG